MDDLSLNDSLETDFLDLLASGAPQGVFESGAKLMIGDDWPKIGMEIVREYEPSMMKVLQKYLREMNGAD